MNNRGHIDWYGAPKPVYYWYKNACRPVITLADFERFVYHPGEQLNPGLIAVNDTHAPVEAEVGIVVFGLEGRRLQEEHQSVSIPADDRVALEMLAFSIPVDLARKVLYLALRTSIDGAIVHRNTYYIAVSPDTHHAGGVDLGDSMTLHYMDRTRKVSAPHYYTLAEIVDEPTEHDKEQKEAADDELEATYSTTFDVPSHLSEKDLEVYLPGPSADDVVKVNGTLIGEGRIDLEKEWNYEADPLRWPNLPNRHYPVPGELLRPTGNSLEIHLSGRRLAAGTDKRFGLTRRIYLREKTPADQREALADYNRRMEFFRPVVEGPRARLSAAVGDPHGNGIRRLRITNQGPASAAFPVLDLANEGSARFTFDDDAPAAVHPDETIEIELKHEGALPREAALVLRCLNADPLSVPLS